MARKFDMRAELAEIYNELETVVEVRNGQAWRDFKLMLEEWVFDLDESIPVSYTHLTLPTILLV